MLDTYHRKLTRIVDWPALITIRPPDARGCIALSLSLMGGAVAETRSFIMSPMRTVRITMTRGAAASPVVRISCGSLKISIRADSLETAAAWAGVLAACGFTLVGVPGTLSLGDDDDDDDEGVSGGEEDARQHAEHRPRRELSQASV